MPLTAKGEEIKSALVKEYGSEKKGEQVLYAGKNKGTFTGIDSETLNRIADAVGSLVARFDAMASRKDAAVTPSEYKQLVKDKNDAQAALAALYKKAETSGYAGLNFRNLEADYTRASNALAAAQAKMSRE